jgi:hypothetical protein
VDRENEEEETNWSRQINPLHSPTQNVVKREDHSFLVLLILSKKKLESDFRKISLFYQKKIS